MRSWARRDFYLDTVDILWPVGRGSPTGVVCYRHDQFPEHYRGGVFALDWTFGKVYFFPLRPDGASYATEAEVFLEPTGTHGFAPTDAVVAPDGVALRQHRRAEDPRGRLPGRVRRRTAVIRRS